jgi:serine/threonine protein kinase/formylglycine-generating enzyme required for sulfatase activity
MADLQTAGEPHKGEQTGLTKSISARSADNGPLDPLPVRFGRYRITGRLGAGGFGVVYQGFDEELKRPVAVKVPHAHRIAAKEDVESYLAEARVLASLDHPGIVSIYDVGRTPEGGCFLVSKFIAGSDLRARLRQEKPPPAEAVELVAQVAEALDHAHRRGVVHRDIKPGNILLDSGARPVIADFGLALREEDFGKGGAWAGSLHYMSPEQASGEGHRVGPRTDVYSLGVVFFELLTGRRPFPSDRPSEVIEQIKALEPPPPRQYDAGIPRELDRICLKALSKRAADRHSTALDLAEDLRHWQRTQAQESPPPDLWPTVCPPAAAGAAAEPPLSRSDGSALKVLPRGLRSFEAADADFFLELLPGPRDRDGLPSSVRFWKTRIEETDLDKTFRIGLLYGPSGCGKTSLVKAALLPRLGEHVAPCYLEAGATDTEGRLAGVLQRHFPGLADGMGLVEMLTALRRGRGLERGRKLLIVLDQFEQWLHAHRNEANADLVQALRQCDGRVQALVLVRDDFGMAAAQFMDALETPLVQGENFATVGLFDTRHARKVLAAFGRAFGQLPDAPGNLSPGQSQFLDRAVASLAQEGAIIPVRLALFAEMIKARPWTPTTIKEVGGAHGIGVAFLEDTFEGRGANPRHRRHQAAAQNVLQMLLPDAGVELKGHVRPRQELQKASGYAARPEPFDELMRILDAELRLVTPIDPGDSPPGRVEADPGQYCYQLAHDYLVPSLREWLTRKQKETWRGRAQLLLTERTAQWAPSGKRRFLPSLPEYLFMALGVPRGRRKAAEQSLMRTAARYHSLVCAVILGMMLLSGLGLGFYVASVWRGADRDRAEGLVDVALNAAPADVPQALANLEPLHDYALPVLRDRFEAAGAESRRRLHAAFGLATLGEVKQDFLLDQVGRTPASEARNMVAALARAGGPACDALWRRIRQSRDAKLRARLAIVLLDLGDPRGARSALALGPDPSCRTAFIHQYPAWRASVTSLPVLLETTRDSGLRSGLCAALGLIQPDTLAEGDRQALQKTLQELHGTAPDGGTQSAAGWALRRWGVPVPAVERTRHVPKGRHWFVNRQGMTMLEVPPGDLRTGGPTSRTVRVNRGLFICERETWLDLFQKFIEDPNYPAAQKPRGWQKPLKRIFPTGDCPAGQVSWEDAVLFCNWLSWQEGRQRCYCLLRGTAAGMVKENERDRWKLDGQADGYRLPTQDEWEYACRAGTHTAYSFGNDPELGSQYAYIFPNSRAHSWPGGGKLPNAWGLFDCYGNVAEWCWDGQTHGVQGNNGGTKGPSGSSGVIACGGDYLSLEVPDLKRRLGEQRRRATVRMPETGFRVVCQEHPGKGGLAP